MNFLKDVYDKKLAENQEKLQFWENYLKSLRALNFRLFSDKLAVPILVPIGSRIFFRGALKHTNELTISLGADYFVKCSLQQAEILRNHRIKDAESKLHILIKEKDYLESQINFGRENIFGNVGHEVIEVQTEAEDRAWRKKHRENVRLYHESKNKNLEFLYNEVSDKELWNKLDELEIQEELENELSKYGDNEDINVMIRENEQNKEEYQNDENFIEKVNSIVEENVESESKELCSKQDQNIDLLQHILDKQNDLEKKLTDLKNRDRSASKTESDIISRLDELEQLDELEDEIDRLDNILHEDNEVIEDYQTSFIKLKRSVSFADEDESETLELTFEHSETEPSKEPYNPEKGIIKPSDLYAAFSDLFTETSTILKKTKYECSIREPVKNDVNQKIKPKPIVNSENIHDLKKTIVVNDVTEKVIVTENTLDSGQTRPISIFKKRRQQKF